ncbi:ATP-binding response regulator [Haloplanus aerogenes]|uniref:histidine kinase n=1 Tax=Haloplanus aerogenes TaxID=660522 RepID=A0A3M0DW66_9EURY|nr:ATP-binding protein [Haloplanus aerogenes]AZH25533.1 response regulator [Haloplanus aerogenes]RMB25247.1 PAS domain S-box-containing protein [Haloplanus aerogenes]
MRVENEPITVLYVNDDPDLLELLVTGLEREVEQLTVRTATSAQKGLEILDDEPIDCILSDYHMPERTGVEFLRTVRAQDEEIPFVMFTETGSESVASAAISANVTDYIVRETLENQHPLVAQRIITYVERHRMEERAAEADERLHELADMSNDVLWTFSADWDELLFVNAAYEPVFGQPAETLRAAPESFLEGVHPDDLDRVKLAMQRVSEGQAQQIEFRVEHPSSIQRWVESHCKPIVAEDGTVERVTGFTRDITERKTHERDLANRNEKLNQFTSTVAHDLRNPLNVVNGHLDIARRECDSDHLATCSRAIEQMSDMLKDLLSLARTGQTIGELTTVDFADLVRASGTNTAMARRTLDIVDSARIRCDPNRLKEAFENLLRNASEHNTQPVTVTAGVLPDRSGVYIEDDGDGIPESRREQVFESGHTTLKQGTGFGLSIVEQVVEAHGWRIDVRTAESGGARFEITGMEFVD